jgi:hypothetical protein
MPLLAFARWERGSWVMPAVASKYTPETSPTDVMNGDCSGSGAERGGTAVVALTF